MKYMHKILSIGLSIIFGFFCLQSWNKFKLGRTNFSINEKRNPSIQYPSITVCPSLPFKIDIFENITIDMKADLTLVKKYHKTLNDTFFFVNQETKSSLGFPCMTTRASTDPGRPCSFPAFMDKGVGSSRK